MPAFDALQNSAQENVYSAAVHQLPAAITDFGKEVWAHPGQTALALGTDAAVSAGMGFALASLMPAKGPAGWVIGAAFTVPMLYKGAEALIHAHQEAAKPGANVDQIGRQLADGVVNNGVNLGVTFAAGWGGAELGYKAGASDTAFGRFSRQTRTKIGNVENLALIKANLGINAAKGLMDSAFSSNATGGSLGAHAEAAIAAPTLIAGKPLSVINDMPVASRLGTTVGTRITHLTQSADDFSGLTEAKFLIHGHTLLSDGDATPQSFIDHVKAAGYDGNLASEHDHILARKGVPPSDERATAEQGTPIVGANPQEEQTARDVALANTVPGKFFDWGEELGTIGKLPPQLDATGKQIPRGANHTGIYNYPGYLRTGGPPLPDGAPGAGGGAGDGGDSGNFVGNAVRAIGRRLGFKADAPISITDIPDGRFDLVAQAIDQATAQGLNPDGSPIVAIMNHPRTAYDFSSKTPLNQQGHDYGMSQFGSFQNWLAKWGDKYIRGIEIMKGGALTEKPIAIIPPSFYSSLDAQTMWDKGVHMGVSAGPDIHYQARIGQPPLATTLMTKSIDRAGVYDALNSRRMAVTSNMDKLTAYMTANDGQFMMGNILDQTVVGTQGLKPEVHIGGTITPDANYTVNIWSDPKTGDGQLAQVVQTKTISGTDLANQNNVVTMDPIQHEAGNQSLIYAEVQRTDGSSPTYGEIMGTTERNPDGTAANVVKNEKGEVFVKGLVDHLEVTEEGGLEGHMDVDFGQTPVTNIDVLDAINKPPSTPYPERAITSPIFVDPISGVGTAHSHLIRGITTGSAGLMPIFPTTVPLDQQK